MHYVSNMACLDLLWLGEKYLFQLAHTHTHTHTHTHVTIKSASSAAECASVPKYERN